MVEPYCQLRMSHLLVFGGQACDKAPLHCHLADIFRGENFHKFHVSVVIYIIRTRINPGSLYIIVTFNSLLVHRFCVTKAGWSTISGCHLFGMLHSG